MVFSAIIEYSTPSYFGQTFQIRFCVATALCQLGGADPLFLNSGKGQSTLLRLTTPPATDSGSVSLPEKALVLNPRGRSVRVRLARKSESGGEEGRFPQFPVVAPLNHMQAPPGEAQALAPVSRYYRVQFPYSSLVAQAALEITSQISRY